MQNITDHYLLVFPVIKENGNENLVLTEGIVKHLFDLSCSTCFTSDQILLNLEMNDLQRAMIFLGIHHNFMSIYISYDFPYTENYF